MKLHSVDFQQVVLEPKSQYFSTNLDILRAAAVACVFVGHFFSAAFHDRELMSLGRFGVILFFVHTSYVLMASLDRLSRKTSNDRLITKAFWIRRFFRIYPLAVSTVMAMVILRIPSSPGGTYHWIGWEGLLANLALSQNLVYKQDIIGVLWSLPLEVQMYVVLPFAYLLIRKWRYSSIPLWAASLAVALVYSHWHLIHRLGVLLYSPCFCSGILAYDIVRRSKTRFKLPFWVWPIGILCTVILFEPNDNIDLGHKIIRAWVLSLAVGLLFAHTSEAPALKLQKVFNWIAEHSYSIYLSHSIILWLCFDELFGIPFALKILLLMALVPGIPAILYRFIEKPLMDVGANLSKWTVTPLEISHIQT